MEQDKWDVIEESIISIFDFNRFVIWNDLRTNRENMSEHPLISSLISNTLNEELIEDGEVSTELPSDEVALPISADSSQLAAINEAASGKSFILHGPPGTGKSQTITNIISNALFHGKRVLFVAEKMTALEVVQKRLAAIGLDPFCLELHSNKTKKSLVMDQLRKTTEVVQQMGDDAFVKEATHLDELKQELNAHVERLHKVYGCGLSVYDCFVRYSEIDIPDEAIVKLPIEYIENLTADRLRTHTELVENYESVAKMVVEHNNDLREIGLLEYSPDIRTSIQNHTEEILSKIEYLQKVKGELTALLGFSTTEFTKEQYDALNSVVEVLLGNEIPSGFIANLNADFIKELNELADIKEQLEKQTTELFTRFNEHILDVDYKPLRQRWIEAENKWFLAKYLERKSVLNTLSSYANNGIRIEETSVLSIFNELDKMSCLQKESDELLD